MNKERYIRQTSLKGFGLRAQERLSKARVLVVGAGGLGVPVLQYLNAMGVGTIGLIDNDVVSLTNLHRQVIYSELDIDQPKVTTAIEKLKVQNSDTKLVGYDRFLTTHNAIEIIENYDLVVDASDNFPTRYLVNDACVILGKPFVYGALQGFEGYVSVFNYKGGPTYRCLFPVMPRAEEIPNCNELGVLGILPGIIGNLQALEAVKVLTELGTPLSGKLLVFNSLEQDYHKFNVQLKPANKKITELRSNYELECTVDQLSIASGAFSELLNSNKAIQLIDVRTKAEFKEFHLEQAIHIPLDTLAENSTTIDYSRPAYLICQSGIRSLKAIQILRKYQPEATLINIEGGLNQWKQYAT